MQQPSPGKLIAFLVRLPANSHSNFKPLVPSNGLNPGPGEVTIFSEDGSKSSCTSLQRPKGLAADLVKVRAVLKRGIFRNHRSP